MSGRSAAASVTHIPPETTPESTALSVLCDFSRDFGLPGFSTFTLARSTLLMQQPRHLRNNLISLSCWHLEKICVIPPGPLSHWSHSTHVMLALDFFFDFLSRHQSTGYPVTDGNLSAALYWSQAFVVQPAIQSLTSASGLLRRATWPFSARLSLYWMFGTPQRHNTTDGPTRLQKMHANSHPTRGPVQARHYSACWCSSPWAEIAREYCVEERSGPQGPSPPPPSRTFTMLHLVYSLSADLLSTHMASTSLLQDDSQALKLVRSGNPERGPNLPVSAPPNLEMPPRLHVLQSRRPQPFPAPPWLHTFLCKSVNVWVRRWLRSQVR